MKKQLLGYVIIFLTICFVSNAKAQKNYKISLLLPLNFQSIDPNSTLDQKTFEGSLVGIDYFRGFKLALDSIAQNLDNDYAFDIKVFDSESDSNKVKQLASDNFINESDIIFALLGTADLQRFNDLRINKKSMIVSALAPQQLEQWKNSNIVVANAPIEVHAKQMALKSLEVTNGQKFMLIRQGLLAETKYSIPFREALDTNARKRCKEILISKQGYGNIQYQLKRNQENVLVVASGDQAFAINLFKYLESLPEEFDIRLLVHPKWIDFQTIDPMLYSKYKVIVSSSYYVDYLGSEEVNVVLEKYRAHYNAEPTEQSWKGFDHGMYYLKQLFKLKQKDNDSEIYNGLCSQFKNRVQKANEQLFMLQYADDGLSLIK